MNWNDLTKEQKLLVYFYGALVNDKVNFVISDDIDSVIAYGITKSKTSLNSMLQTLKNKRWIESLGNGEWSLTDDGYDYAEALCHELDDEDEPSDEDDIDENQHNFDEQPDPTTNVAFDAMSKSFAAMAESFKAMEQAFAALAKTFKNMA